jgi:UDP-N-acetylmuramoyl-tripeptide--D-alanyl-D-alanine ligase
MAARTTARVVLYGESPDADVRAENVAARYPERLSFDLVIGQNRRAVRTRFVSTLMLPTLLSALSVVHAAEHDVDAAVAALAKMEPMPDRLGVHAGSDGKTYIVDTTKAPHWSVLLLIKEIRAWQLPDLVVVLGDVSDVRREKARIYRTLLRSFSEFAMEVVATGEAARQVDELRSQGTSNIVAAPTALDVARHLATRPPCVVLLKANSSSQTWRAAAPAVSAQLRQERRRL